MKIDFGIVKKYFADRGFGFVGHIFLNPHSQEIFFHIKNIKRLDLNLSRKIENKNFTEDIFFWYEIEKSKKGEEVYSVLNSESIHSKYSDILPVLIEKVESIWRNIDLQVPKWINQVSIDLIGIERTSELKIKRDKLELERDERDEKKYKEAKALQEIENSEFEQLLNEMIPLKFTNSSEVSSYIMENKLGDKYKNISGVIKMELEGRTWNFKGGFPPKIYARICSELGLGNKGSYARVVGFDSFKNLGE